ncbi:LOW QUALITY PROTEIN: early endosome antigen 1-like [Melanaphis sacchari]|uniref:LOW QUALITY PROTEIN: early endosome antigen 1-like n=1 Tax=Melanaphis sacchari TaxID=742174 RepID=UPI000DC14283|nr:LOW QUALITY PROTEIN: early endosome antigen 1-like [Melanaphis sacchari]
MSEYVEVMNELENDMLTDEKETLENHSTHFMSIEDPNLDPKSTSHEYKQEINSSFYLNETETEVYKNCSDSIISLEQFKNVNSGSMTSQSTNNTLKNQQIVLTSDNPLMAKIQNILKLQLLKQKENIKKGILTLCGVIKIKEKEKSSAIDLIKSANCRVAAQQKLLSDFHRMKGQLETAKQKLKINIEQKMQCNKEIFAKIADEEKKVSVLKRQIECSRGFLNELNKYEKEQEITFNKCNQTKSQAKQYKKKLLNNQQKQDLLLLSLTQENLRLEDRIKQLGEQAEAKFNENEVLRQKVMDNSISLDAINKDNVKYTLLWNDIIISIQQCEKSSQKKIKDLEEEKNKYHILLTEYYSYKRSSQNECHKYDELMYYLNKCTQNQNNLQNGFNTCLENFNHLRDKYFNILKMTEIQNQNLKEVIFEQQSVQNELNKLLYLKNNISNQKLIHEDNILEEYKNESITDCYCQKMNSSILDLKKKNNENESLLVKIENDVCLDQIKLKQYRTTTYNLKKQIKELDKNLDQHDLYITSLDSKLKKLNTDIQIISNTIESENKELESLKKKQEVGDDMTPQMQIDHVRSQINDVVKKTNVIKQYCIQNQNQNVKLLDEKNKQIVELNKMREYDIQNIIKSRKLDHEIVSLSKEVDQYKRTLTNMRNKIVIYNEVFGKNKGESNKLLNENEWIQSSALVELKENEKQCLEYMDHLKFLKNEVNEMKKTFIEKQRESKSWDVKVQSLVDIKTELKNKQGIFGDIEASQKEIHKMQIIESRLKKVLGKIMMDLEKCISKRDTIYTTFAAKNTRSNGKNDKQKLLKILDDKRIMIRKIKTKCKKIDKDISNRQNYKMELECKLAHLRDRFIDIEQNMNDLTKIIEDMNALKLKNFYKLNYKQNLVKFFDDIKKEKYRLLIKSESKMNEAIKAQSLKNSNLITVVECLKKDFLYLNVELTRLLLTLKSIDD